MKYIDLINNFWLNDEAHEFTANATRLYFYLLKVANSLAWKQNPFWHSDGKTAMNARFGSVNTMKAARNQLKQAGLIEFTAGGNGYGNKTRYQILTPNLIPKYKPNPQPNSPPLTREDEDFFTSFKPPTLKEVSDYAQISGGNEAMANDFFTHYQTQGWVLGNGVPIADWREAFKKWKTNQRSKNNGTNNNSRPATGKQPEFNETVERARRRASGESVAGIAQNLAQLANSPPRIAARNGS